jgi:long-chain fatty acid transport protein
MLSSRGMGMLIFHSLGKTGWQGNGFALAIMMAVSLYCWCPSWTWASGFALVQQGTAAMAQGNAFVAEASDASAVFYNPAGLNQLKRIQFYQGSFFNYPDREYSGGGLDSQTNHRLYRAMTAYIAIPVHNRVALGFGFFSPFGMGTVWPPTWAGRYLTTYSSIHTYNLNPVISVKVLDNLSLAAGYNIMWSKVRLQRKIPVVFRGRTFPDGETRVTGEGSGSGFNLGLHYEPVSGVKLGAAYRSQIKVNHSGGFSTSLPAPLGAGPSSQGEASIVYPPSLTMGIAYSRFKPFAFEFDTTWTGWSSYDKLKINLDTPILVNGVPYTTLTVPKNWHDTWAFRFGASYDVTDYMKLRAGYIYDLTPVPGSSFDPQVPDANRHIFTVGQDLKIWRFTLGIAYNYILSEARTKSNTIVTNGFAAPLQANGRYRSDIHSLGLSWAFNF